MNEHVHVTRPDRVRLSPEAMRQINDGVGVVRGVMGDYSARALTSYRRRLVLAKVPIGYELDAALHEMIMRALAMERGK